MFKSILAVMIAVIFSGCIEELSTPTTEDNDHKIKYVEFDNFNVDVSPRLEKGYELVNGGCEVIKSTLNITPDEFLYKAENNWKYDGAEILMVSTNIKDQHYYFKACYLKKIDTQDMILGAKLKPNMPIHIRKKFGSNKGCALGTIYYNTVAYKNDLHENDIIIVANREVITSCNHLIKVLNKSDIVNFVLWADGEEHDVRGVVLNK